VTAAEPLLLRLPLTQPQVPGRDRDEVLDEVAGVVAGWAAGLAR
jgi:hypothetical protein